MRSVRGLSRLRSRKSLRDWVSQTLFTSDDIILPYFVAEGKGIADPVSSMPGVFRFSADNVVKDISRSGGNLRSVLLFGIPARKDNKASESYKKDGVVQNAARAIKKKFRDIIVITDVCPCAYTSHGHCGILRQRTGTRLSDKEAIIDEARTLKLLGKIALSHAEAGADLVAPSAMMDGQVAAIREALDGKGFADVGILAYSAKYASSFYGPFREAADSSPAFGDRRTYQMDFRNSDEALREIGRDIEEGADMVMVKPALAYLDIIYRAKREFKIPLVAYNVSGEYSMVKKISEGDKEAEKNLILETLTSIKRAGADMVITYFGKEAAEWLK